MAAEYHELLAGAHRKRDSIALAPVNRGIDRPCNGEHRRRNVNADNVRLGPKSLEGADAMLAKLSEVVFAETLRRYMRMLPQEQTGWMAAARDPEVGRALTLLHHRHGDPWTVATLAQEVGLSRTVLAERFRHFLGLSPMAYLTRWRLQMGARSLT